MSYTPRRAPKRLLNEDCPKEVLAIYDNGGKTFDRYTVIYNCVTFYNGIYTVFYRGMSEYPSDPQGFGISGELNSWELAAYRNRAYRDYAKWSDMPEDVKNAVRDDCRLIREDSHNV